MYFIITTPKMNPYQKAKIYTFYLPNVEGVVYIHGSIQPPASRSISSLNQRRVTYLNRLQMDESKRSPRLDALAQIFAGEDYRYETINYPCLSRKALYRKCESMYAKLSAEQIARNRATRRACYARNREKESARHAEYLKTNRDKVNAQKRDAYHHGTRCKEYKPQNTEPMPEFGVKSVPCTVTFD